MNADRRSSQSDCRSQQTCFILCKHTRFQSSSRSLSDAVFLSACGQSTKCFLCFGFSRAPPTVLHSASFCLCFLSHQMLSKYLHNWQFGLFIFPLPLHPLLVFSSSQADIYSYLCDKSHASTMTADDYGKMGGVEVRRWEDSGGLWTASCWGKIQK